MIDFGCFYDWEMGFCLFLRLGDGILPVFTIGGCDFACFYDWEMGFCLFSRLGDVILKLFQRCGIFCFSFYYRT
jgi:hypothetical protein